jgi:hypothetical protein
VRVPPLSALKETDLQIDATTPVGRQILTAFRNLFAQLNPWIDALNKLTSKGVGLTDNVQCELVLGTFSHGVPGLVRLKALTRAEGAVALGALGQVTTAATVTMVQPPAGQREGPVLASVTVYFLNPAAANVQTSVLLLPEGQQSG